MKKISSTTLITLALAYAGFAQQSFYDVMAGDGNGIRFWSGDNYKIHMGNSSEYHFGPVTDYSIKLNMSSNVGRGWTWGINGAAPVAALNNVGHMQIAGTFFSTQLDISSSNTDLTLAKLRNNTWACNQRTSIEFWNGGLKNYPTSRIVSQMDGCGGDGEALLFETQTAGQTSPSTKLTIKNNGNVGIGTASPAFKLDVSGNLRTTSFINANEYITVQNGGSYRVAMNGQSDGYVIGRNASNQDKFLINANGNSYFNGGNVGIGTTSPDSKLTVKGTIHAEEVKVDLNVPGPDYVFEPSYKLLSLEEIKSYIDQHKHLPEVPSAKEMETNGVNVSEMNMLLLKKIEELTLYVIELKKENILIKEEIKQLRNEK